MVWNRVRSVRLLFLGVIPLSSLLLMSSFCDTQTSPTDSDAETGQS